MKSKKLLLILLSLLSVPVFSSCPNMTGDFALRCNCRESQMGLPTKAFQCEKDSDCQAIEGNCADWAIVNASYIKMNNISFKNNLKNLKLTPRPNVECKLKTCMIK